MNKKVMYCTMGLCTALQLPAGAQNVGVGTRAPVYPLTVKDTLNTGAGKGFAQVSPNGQIALGTYADNTTAIIQTHTNTDLSFSTGGGAAKMVLQHPTGNFGINTLSPTEKLQVDGNAKVSGNVEAGGLIKIAGGSPGAGKVLTAADAAGNAQWRTPGAGFYAIKTTSTNIPDGVVTVVDFKDITTPQSPGFDTLSAEFTAPASGVYMFDVQLECSHGSIAGSSASFNISTQLWKRTAGGTAVRVFAKGFSNEAHLDIVTAIPLNAGDMVSVRVFHNWPLAVSILGSGANLYTHFSGHRIF